MDNLIRISTVREGYLVKPAEIDDAPEAVLIQVLRTFPDERVSICYAPSASDGRSYAEDFLCVFKAIGWDVDGPETAHEPTELRPD
jgi:hypothetical protein